MTTKYKFKAKEIKYIVNENAVICIVFPNYNMLPEEIDSMYCQLEIDYDEFYPSFFKGVARLKDGDTNDIEVAKEIARQKAYRAAFRYQARMFEKMWQSLATQLVDFGKYIDCAEAKFKKCDSTIAELTKR